MVSRTGVPAAIRVLPSAPVTFSETLAITVPPTVSRREVIESSSAAWISVPTGRVRIAAVDLTGLTLAVALLVFGAPVVSAILVVAVVSELRVVSAEAERTVSRLALSVRRVTVSAGGVVAVSFVLLDAVSGARLLGVLSGAGGDSLGAEGA